MSRRCSLCRQTGHNVSRCPDMNSYFEQINNFTSSVEAYNIMATYPKNVLYRYVSIHLTTEQNIGFTSASKDELIQMIVQVKFPEVQLNDESDDYILDFLASLICVPEVTGKYILTPLFEGTVSNIPIAEANPVESIRDDIPMATFVQVL